MDSGTLLGGATTVSDVAPEWQKLARKAGCAQDPVGCLVALPASDLLSAPLVDGVDLLADPSLLGAQGAPAPGVQVLAGSADFEKAYAGRGFDTSALAAIYADEEAIGGYSKWYWAAVHAGGDSVMGCPARRACGWYESEGAYRYWFTHVPRGPTGAFPNLCHHACEIPFVFHVNVPMNGEKGGDEFILPSEHALSAAMVTYSQESRR
eukprot:gene6101-21351_t